MEVTRKGISLPIAMRSSGSKIILLKLTLENIPGALAKVAKVLADHGVNILSSIINASKGAQNATMISFVDYTRVQESIEELANKLRELNVVLDVTVVKPQMPGLIVNELLYPLSYMGVRVVCFHIACIGELLRQLYNKFGPSAKALMYYAGYSGIKKIVGALYGITGLKDLALLHACLQLFKASGFGEFEIKSFNLKPVHISIEAYDLFECVPFKGELKEPNSQIFRGILAETVEEIAREPALAIEEKCIAKGDPYCKFIIKRRKI